MSGVWKKAINAVLRGGIPDKGFMRDIHVGILGLRLASDFSALTAATNPTLTTANNVPKFVWATTQLQAVAFQHVIGRELAMASANATKSGGPTIRVKGLIRTGGNTDTPTWTMTCYARTTAGVLKAVFTNTAAVVGTKNLTNPELVTWDFTLIQNATPFFLEPGDTLTFVLTPSGAHGTDTYELHSLWLEAAHNSSYTDISLRAVLDN